MSYLLDISTISRQWMNGQNEVQWILVVKILKINLNITKLSVLTKLVGTRQSVLDTTIIINITLILPLTDRYYENPLSIPTARKKST